LKANEEQNVLPRSLISRPVQFYFCDQEFTHTDCVNNVRYIYCVSMCNL